MTSDTWLKSLVYSLFVTTLMVEGGSASAASEVAETSSRPLCYTLIISYLVTDDFKQEFDDCTVEESALPEAPPASLYAITLSRENNVIKAEFSKDCPTFLCDLVNYHLNINSVQQTGEQSALFRKPLIRDECARVGWQQVRDRCEFQDVQDVAAKNPIVTVQAVLSMVDLVDELLSVDCTRLSILEAEKTAWSNIVGGVDESIKQATEEMTKRQKAELEAAQSNLANRETLLAKQQAELEAAQRALVNKELKLGKQQERMKANKQALASKEAELNAKEDDQATQAANLAERDKALKDQQAKFREETRVFNENFDRQRKEMEVQQKSMREQRTAITRQEDELKRKRDAELAEIALLTTKSEDERRKLREALEHEYTCSMSEIAVREAAIARNEERLREEQRAQGEQAKNEREALEAKQREVQASINAQHAALEKQMKEVKYARLQTHFASQPENIRKAIMQCAQRSASERPAQNPARQAQVNPDDRWNTIRLVCQFVATVTEVSLPMGDSLTLAGTTIAKADCADMGAVKEKMLKIFKDSGIVWKDDTISWVETSTTQSERAH